MHKSHRRPTDTARHVQYQLVRSSGLWGAFILASLLMPQNDTAGAQECHISNFGSCETRPPNVRAGGP